MTTTKQTMRRLPTSNASRASLDVFSVLPPEVSITVLEHSTVGTLFNMTLVSSLWNTSLKRSDIWQKKYLEVHNYVPKAIIEQHMVPSAWKNHLAQWIRTNSTHLFTLDDGSTVYVSSFSVKSHQGIYLLGGPSKEKNDAAVAKERKPHTWVIEPPRKERNRGKNEWLPDRICRVRIESGNFVEGAGMDVVFWCDLNELKLSNVYWHDTLYRYVRSAPFKKLAETWTMDDL